jgi:hypothetical protein
MSLRHRAFPAAGRIDGAEGGLDLPELLLAVSERAQSGRLSLTTADVEKEVFLAGGKVVFASSSSPDDRLGVYLLARNELSLAALRRLSPRVQPGVRLGTLLVQQGLLHAEDLVRAVEGQIRSILVGLFRSPPGHYRFVETPPPHEETIQVSIPTPQLVLDGIEAVESWRRVLHALGSLDRRYGTVPGSEGSLRDLDLDTASLELLALLSHSKTVEEICASSELPDIAVCRRLWAFRLLGFVEALPAEPMEDSTADLDMDLEALGLILSEKRSSENEPRTG